MSSENAVSTEEEFLKVAGGSSPQSVASAIAHALYVDNHVKIRAIGASAVNQAVKALAIARGFVATRGQNLVCWPGFMTIEGNDSDISAIVFIVTSS